MMRCLICIFVFVLTILDTVNVWAWNAQQTHQDLSEKAADHSILSQVKGNYLKNLGFTKNLEEPFILDGQSETVKAWIRLGALEEDAGNIFTGYYYNHFHNPLRAWGQAGLDTIYPGLNGISSLIWAQDTSTSNPWRWQEVRNHYHLALTSPTNTQREETFAKTFKGLGHWGLQQNRVTFL